MIDSTKPPVEGIDKELLTRMISPEDMDPGGDWKEANVILTELKHLDDIEYCTRHIPPDEDKHMDTQTAEQEEHLGRRIDVACNTEMATSTSSAMDFLKHSFKTDARIHNHVSFVEREAIGYERPETTKAKPLKSCFRDTTAGKSQYLRKKISFGKIDVEVYFITKEEKEFKLVDCRNYFVECNGRKLRDMSSSDYGIEELDNLDLFLARKLKYKRVEDTTYSDHKDEVRELKIENPANTKPRKTITILTCDIINKELDKDIVETKSIEDIGLSTKQPIQYKFEESAKPEHQLKQDYQMHPGTFQQCVAHGKIKSSIPGKPQRPSPALSTDVSNMRTSDVTLPVRIKEEIENRALHNTSRKTTQSADTATERTRRKMKLTNKMVKGVTGLSGEGPSSVQTPVPVAWGDHVKSKRHISKALTNNHSVHESDEGNRYGKSQRHPSKWKLTEMSAPNKMDAKPQPSRIIAQEQPSCQKSKIRRDNSTVTDIQNIQTPNCERVSKSGVSMITVRSKAGDGIMEWDNTEEPDLTEHNSCNLSDGRDKLQGGFTKYKVNIQEEKRCERLGFASKSVCKTPASRIMLNDADDNSNQCDDTGTRDRETQETAHLKRSDVSPLCRNVATKTEEKKESRLNEENLPSLYSSPGTGIKRRDSRPRCTDSPSSGILTAGRSDCTGSLAHKSRKTSISTRLRSLARRFQRGLFNIGQTLRALSCVKTP